MNDDEEYYIGTEVMQELVKRFDIPFYLKDGTTYLQNVRLDLLPNELPKLTCEYVIAKLDKVVEEEE